MERKPDGTFQKGTHWRVKKPFWDKDWCIQEYVTNQRSAADIAQQFGVTENAVLFWLGKHGIKGRSVSEVRSFKHWGSSGEDNPMWNKFGELSPNWKGGVTPERQAFYESREWKDSCKAVWKRDNAACQRCKLTRKEAMDTPFHIHHIQGFEHREVRADTGNLILLCVICHRFVHSRRNTNREFLQE